VDLLTSSTALLARTLRATFACAQQNSGIGWVQGILSAAVTHDNFRRRAARRDEKIELMTLSLRDMYAVNILDNRAAKSGLAQRFRAADTWLRDSCGSAPAIPARTC
jgi:hypothetical protein